MDPAAAKPASDLLTAGGIVTVLASVGALITTSIAAWTSMRVRTAIAHEAVALKEASVRAKEATIGVKQQVALVQETNEVQLQKLEEINALVALRHGELLQQLADSKRMCAFQTGNPADTAAAIVAQEAANAQRTQANTVIEAIAAGNGAKSEDPKP